MADRPHYLSVLLSLLALAISAFSWWESHSARLANQSSNRAIVSLTGFEPIAAQKPEQYLYRLGVKNFGRSAATVPCYKISVVVDKSWQELDDYRGEQNVIEYSIPPGAEKDATVEIPWSKIPGPQEGESRFIIVDLEYVDDPTHQEYQQWWCYKIEGDGKFGACEDFY